MYEGEPIAGGGRVRFVPLDSHGEPADGKAAIGELALDGTFQLTTYEAKDGALIGEHRVEIVQNHVLKPAEYASDPAPRNGGAVPTPILVRASQLVPPEDRIPSIYSGPQSPLRAAVEFGQTAMQFDLIRQ